MDSPTGDKHPPEPHDEPAAESSRLTRLVDTLVLAARQWGIVAVIVGLAPGLAVWPLLHHENLGYVLSGDQLDVDQRMDIVKYMLASLAGVGALYLAAFLVLRRKARRLRMGDVFGRLNRYTFVVASLPLLTALMHRGIETEHEFITMLLIVVCTACMGVLIYRLYEFRPERPASEERVRYPWAPPMAVVGLFLFYALYVSYLALLDHRNLGTHVYDLGIYDNIFWHNANGDFMGCSYCKTGKHMSSHFDPILFLLSPIYRLNPRAETILVLQAVWVATAVVPVYLIGKRRLGNPWLGVILAAIFVCYPATHGVNMFDFHSLTLVVPTLLWAIYFVDSGAKWRFWLVFGIMLLTREDISLLSCFIGVYAILRRRPVMGLVMIVVALAYLTLIKAYVMNDPGLIMQKSKESTSFHYFYEEMIPHEEEGMKGLVITALIDPVYTAKVFLKEQKVFFFLLLLLPLLFLPLASGKKTIMMVYGLLFIGAATRKYVYSPYFQYSSVLFPIMIAALPDGVDRVSRSRVAQVYGIKRRRLVWTLMWTSLVATLLCTHKYGAFWGNDAFRAGWNRLARGEPDRREARYRFVRRIIEEHIPPDASVSASSSIGAHVSNREGIVKWPSHRDSDYLLLTAGRFKKKSRRRLERLMRRGAYRLLESEYGIELYERVPEEERDEVRREYREKEREKNKAKGKGKPHAKASSVRARAEDRRGPDGKVRPNSGSRPTSDPIDLPRPEDVVEGPDAERQEASEDRRDLEPLDDDLDDEAAEEGEEEGRRPG